MIKRYMRRKDGLRHDMEQAWDFEPDIDDPCINITDDNRLKYQVALMAYIEEIKQDKERYDPNDLLYYQKYKILEPEEKSDNPLFPAIEIVDPHEAKKTIRYQPFVLIYQSLEMRNDMITYGQNIVCLDSTFGTTGAIFIMQHETHQILTGMFSILQDHVLKVSAHELNPKVVMTDKDDTEIGAVRTHWPDAKNWLCNVHDGRLFDHRLPPYTGKKGAIVLKPLLCK
eukprot:925920_1